MMNPHCLHTMSGALNATGRKASQTSQYSRDMSARGGSIDGACLSMRDPSALPQLPGWHLGLVGERTRQALAGVVGTENSYRRLALFSGHSLSPAEEVEEQQDHYGKDYDRHATEPVTARVFRDCTRVGPAKFRRVPARLAILDIHTALRMPACSP